MRLCLSLDESLLTLTKHAGILILKTGVTRDGRLTARKSEIQLDGGAYSDASALTVVKTGYRITGPYRWHAVATRAYAVRTNTVPAGSFRGFGGTLDSVAHWPRNDADHGEPAPWRPKLAQNLHAGIGPG